MTSLIVTTRLIHSASRLREPAPVFGLAHPPEKLLQLLSLDAHSLGSLQRLGTIGPSRLFPGTRVIHLRAGTEEAAVELSPTYGAPVHVKVVDIDAEMASRTVGLVPESGLRDSRVLVCGAGSVGSNFALLLAQAGVGHFGFYDNGTFEASNLARHVGDLNDLGRFKAVILAEAVRRRGAEASAHTVDLCDVNVEEILGGADLVVATTDSPAAQFSINDACVSTGTPGLFVGAYEMACGGEVIVVQPGGPCLYCAVGFRAKTMPEANLVERRQAYRDTDDNRLQAEPGLGADITYLASCAAAFALGILDPRGRRAGLAERRFTLMHTGSTPEGSYADLFRQPFQHIHARLVRETPCEVCGFAGTTELS